MRFRATLLAAIATTALVACSGSSASTARPTASTGPSGPAPSDSVPGTALDLEHISVTLEPFVTVQGGPLAIAATHDGTGRLFVAAQDGRIWVIENGAVRPEPLVDLSRRLRSGGEQGLLGLDVHPDFPTDPRIFVNYTDEQGDTIVASLAIDPANPNRADPGSHRQILFVDQPFANHNGGGALFGPDGDLYISLGDGGGGGDPQGNGQRTDTLLGKILRIDVGTPGGGEPYTIPPGNPFASDGGRDEIWLTGLRNPWRLSFDRATGDLWIGDVGQSSWEEVDVVRAGASGLNFGWDRMEGNHCFEPREGCDTSGLTTPVAEYGRELGCTIIGGYVYRGSAYPFLQGAYLFADYCSGKVLAIDAASDELSAPVEVGSGSGSISAFGQDDVGELYVTSLDGTVSRVVAATR